MAPSGVEAPVRAAIERMILAWTVLGGGLLLLIVLVTALNVGAYALDGIAGTWGGSVPALLGYEDFVTSTVGAAALMLFPYCQLRRGHVAVDLFVGRLPRSLQGAIDRVSLAAMALLVLALLYWMTLGMLESRADNVLAPILGWREWRFYLPGLVSLGLWFAILMLDLLRPAARP